MNFKISDLFPVRKEDLCRITDETNNAWRKVNTTQDWETGGLSTIDHPLYGMILVCLSEPKLTKIGQMIYYEVYCQQDMKYYELAKDDIQRIL